MTDTTIRRTPPAARQAAHAAAFLATLAAGTHSVGGVHAAYEASATECTVAPLGRTTFYRQASQSLGPRWSTGEGDIFRVASGTTNPDALRDFARDYPIERDALDGFLPGVYVAEVGSRVAATTLFADFEAFAAMHRIIELQRWSNRAFYGALEERGYERKRSTGGKFVVLGVCKAE